MLKRLAFLTIMLFPSLAFAQNSSAPLRLDAPERYMRAGGPHWGHFHSVPTTTRPVLKTTNAYSAVTDLKLFAWGSLVNVSCTAATTLCFVQTATVTILSGNDTGYIQDNGANQPGGGNNPDGTGSCFRVEPGLSVDAIPMQSMFDLGDVGARFGYCSGNANTVGYPCDASGDCGSGGTCNTTSSVLLDSVRNRIRGAFLLSRAASATNCFVREDL